MLYCRCRRIPSKLCPLPEGRKAVGGCCVYSIKLGPQNEEQYQPHYVPKGYSQLPEIDYSEADLFPTAHITKIRTHKLLAIQYNLHVCQMDDKTAVPNAPMDCELYEEQPECFEVKGKKDEKLALKQSCRNWNSMLLLLI